MKAIMTVLKGNLLKRKLYSFIILIFSFFTALTLIASVGIIQKLHFQYVESYTNSNESDIVYVYYKDDYMSDMKDRLAADTSVSNTIEQDGFLGELVVSGDTTQLFLTDKQDDKKYTIAYAQKEWDNILTKNDILLPLTYHDTYNYEAGNEIEIFEETYIIKGFFEDPIFGSPFFEMKRALISNQKMNELITRETPVLAKQVVFLEANLVKSKNGLGEVTKNVTDSFSESQQSIASFTKSDLAQFRTTAPTIILGIVALFSVFLLVIMIFVIRYILISVIEQDYKNMGVLKSLGFKGSQILAITTIQYLLFAFIGILTGAIGAYILTPPIGSYILNVSGILWIGKISFLLMIAIGSGLLFVIFLIILLPVRRIFKIKPIDAIVEKNNVLSKVQLPVSFFKFPLSFLGINAKLSINQLFSSLGQHLSLFGLIILFSFAIMNLVGISNEFSDVENVSAMLGYEVNDIRIDSVDGDSEKIDSLLTKINVEYPIRYQTSFDATNRVVIDNDVSDVQLLIYSKFPCSNVIQGKVPENSNEIIISSGISELYSKTVSDTISIKQKGDSLTEEQYLIVGIYNQVYDMGKNVGMTTTGFEKLSPDYRSYQYLLKMEHNSDIDTLIKEIEENYSEESQGITFSNEQKFVLNRIETIQQVLKIISILVIVVSLILISLITYLLSMVLIKRETFNLGIMKSLGFSSIQIRIQFVSRFFLLATLGVTVGIMFYWLSDNVLINMIFRTINVAPIPADNSPLLICFNYLYILALITLNTWFVSRVIKKISVRKLVSQE